MKNKFNILIVFSILTVNCDFDRGDIVINGYEGLLKEGSWNDAILMMEHVPKDNKRYSEIQQLIKDLKKGYRIFKNARGTWRYRDEGHTYKITFGNNSNSRYLYKLKENTWYLKVRKVHNTGSVWTEGQWQPHVRYLGYEGKGKIIILRYTMTDPERLVVYK